MRYIGYMGDADTNFTDPAIQVGLSYAPWSSEDKVSVLIQYKDDQIWLSKTEAESFIGAMSMAVDAFDEFLATKETEYEQRTAALLAAEVKGF